MACNLTVIAGTNIEICKMAYTIERQRKPIT